VKPLQDFLRRGFNLAEAGFNKFFGPAWNPLYQLGALGFFFFWTIIASGVYVYAVFDTSVIGAYQSVDYMTNEQWYLGGVMRSLHRYASDGLVFIMMLHMLREFSYRRLYGKRWFSWITGAPILWLAYTAGISGYWLVWYKLAQYVATATTEWLDWIPVFGGTIARNLLTEGSTTDRFFTLLVFMHIAIPLIMGLLLWLHLNRISRARINPARGLGIGVFVMMLALSLVKPAVSQGGPADLNTVVSVINLDWFYLGLYPLLDHFPGDQVWFLAAILTLLVIIMPWVTPRKDPRPVVIDLDNCNGCTRCVVDCPYGALTMGPRTDDQPFEGEPVVDASQCVACGICIGACPSATPFRSAKELKTGIDLPDRTLDSLRNQTLEAAEGLSGEARIIVFGCDHAVDLHKLGLPDVAAVSMPCVAMLPPSFIDFILSRNLADGVFLTGCHKGNCYNRFGRRWMDARLAGERDPYLRARVPRERIAICWASAVQGKTLAQQITAFHERLKTMQDVPHIRRRKRRDTPKQEGGNV